MHHKNLETLRSEALRLLELEEEILLQIRNTPRLLKGNTDQELETFTEYKVDNDLKVLAGERTKLQDLDMVIAVVGTMKAGKSTTINAIVGAEVLPNRNAPMTSIPTLIRHVPGQIVPLIKLDNNSPINELCSQIKSMMNSSISRFENIRRESRDMGSLISFIEKGERIRDTYSGEEEIFGFLKIVNDLVRLCRELEVDFPFNAYGEIHELPVIEVQFSSLAGREDGLGTVTLLDTPGPNEAGQMHLRHILRDQLQKASAVLAVLNYTQLRSDSDEELRNEVHAIAEVAKGRMFALVNRFDERKRHDPDEQEIKSLVANKLLDKSIPEDAVFAVSAEQALLAEMARKSLDMQNCLPDPEECRWVEEFARALFGEDDWESKLDDTQLLRKGARRYWDKSGFEEPLSKVIRMAHENAAYYALDSAASKIVFYAEKVSNFVNGRGTALEKTGEELKSHIDDLKRNIEQIAHLRNEKERDAEALLAELEQQMSTAFNDLKKEIREATDQYFKEGKAQEIAKKKELLNSEGMTPSQRKERTDKTTFDQKKRGRPNSSARKNSNRGQKESSKKDFYPNQKSLEFPDKKEALEFVSKVHDSFSKPIDQADQSLFKIIKKSLNDFDDKINKNIAGECHSILKSVARRLADDGFDISFKLPRSLNSRSTRLTNGSLIGGIKKGQKEVTRLRKQDSLLGGVKRIFGGLFYKDWGYDEHQVQIDVFRVNLDDLKLMADKVVEDQISSWQREVDSSVKKPIELAISEFFNELSGKIEAVRADLFQGLEDKQKSHREQEELYQALLELGKPIPGIKEDSEALKGDTEFNLGRVSNE